MAGVGRDRLGCLWPTIDDSSTSSPAIRNSAWRPIEGRELADSVEKLADASFGDVFGGPRTITRWAIVDPGPF
jgi:hypothetical protein